jgi:hypothetical protein
VRRDRRERLPGRLRPLRLGGVAHERIQYDALRAEFPQRVEIPQYLLQRTLPRDPRVVRQRLVRQPEQDPRRERRYRPPERVRDRPQLLEPVAQEVDGVPQRMPRVAVPDRPAQARGGLAADPDRDRTGAVVRGVGPRAPQLGQYLVGLSAAPGMVRAERLDCRPAFVDIYHNWGRKG